MAQTAEKINQPLPAPSAKRARHCIVYLQVHERDALIEYLAVQASKTQDDDLRARVERFAEYIKAGDLV